MDTLKKKFDIDWGIGIMTENPDKFKNKETKYQKDFGLNMMAFGI